MKNLKNRTFEILDIASSDDPPSRIFDVFIMTLISLNVVAVVIETVKTLATKYSNFFAIFEIFSVVVFTLEYVLRLWACTSQKEFKQPLTGRIRFAFTPLALIDLVAILPFYLPMLITLDLRFLRALRLFRLFRMFKLARYSESVQILGHVFKEKKEELIITIFAVFLLLVFASSLMYFIENETQPEAFSSIPSAMWWGVATLTTVGYGDVYPMTPSGKLLGAIIAILGVGLFALPAGILASGFADVIHKRNTNHICPHCGENIHD